MTPRVFKFNKPSNWKPEPEVKDKHEIKTKALKAKPAEPTYENEFAMTRELEEYRQALRKLWDEYRQTKQQEQERARQYPYYYQPIYGISSTINTQDSNTVINPQWGYGGNLPNITK